MSDDRGQRRRFRRIPHEVRVDLVSDNNFYTGFTADVSSGGVFVATVQLLPIGTEVEFELSLDAHVSRVPVRGVVRWVKESEPGGMGIEFLELHPRLKQRIDEFVSRRGGTLFYDSDDD